MAKVKITGHASGTGILTVTAPNTSTDRTITLPDATATLATNENFTSTGIDDNADATAITIDSNENVGIGNTTPEAWDSAFSVLQLGGGAAVWGHSLRAAYLSQNMYNDGAYKYLSTSGASLILMNDGEFKFRVAASGSADAAITWTDTLELKTDGRGLSQFTAKAWANFNMTGTPAFRDSHNFSSITDTATGYAWVNFTNNMANANYCAVASGDATDTWQGAGTHANITNVAYVGVYHVEDNLTKDTALQAVLVFGD